ncbi:MAG: hypothetical protein K2X77_23645 [Candidatus Obscuribacterales bacterium]|jgi:hypothetical protein|nr:hypothetical protein [Candidatus Obscuribacterales bacterium]
MANPKEMTLSALVKRLLELEKVMPEGTLVVSDNGDDGGPAAPLYFDAIVDVVQTHVEQSSEEEHAGSFKEVVLMATGTTASGDIIPAVRLQLKRAH